MGEDWILAVLSHHDRVLVFCGASSSSITDWVPRTTRQVSLLTRWNLWIWNLTSPSTERASVEWRSMEMSGREVDNCWTHKQIHFWGGVSFSWLLILWLSSLRFAREKSSGFAQGDTQYLDTAALSGANTALQVWWSWCQNCQIRVCG